MKKLNDRNQEIVRRFRAGESQCQLAAAYGVSRQRIAEILKQAGFGKHDGGQTVRALHRKRVAVSVTNQHAIETYGLPWPMIKYLRSIGESGKASRPYVAYRHQRRNALRRGLTWDLTFAQWWHLWDSSGHWPNRGRSVGKYILTRRRFEQGFTIANVHIIRFEDVWQGKNHPKHKQKRRTLHGPTVTD